MELNKIAAAILLAGLVGMVAGKASELLYHGGGHHDDAHTKRGYSIEVANVGASGAAPAKKELASISPFLASADIVAGEKYFKKACASCHTADSGGGNKVGPALWNVVNRAIGQEAGFNYSDAIAIKGGVWDYESLNKFLHKPKKWLPGTIMAYVGIRKDTDRANVIAYLRTLSNNPAALPPAAAQEESADEG